MSEAVTMPSPYTSCLIVWPSCITCTTSSLGHSLDFCFTNPFTGTVCWGGISQPRPGTDLEARDVLRLKALWTLLHFELHRLTFIQRLVAVHLNGGEMNEHIFSGLALDESIAFRSIEPLHCSLFLHCCDLSYVIPDVPRPSLIRPRICGTNPETRILRASLGPCPTSYPG